MNDFARIFTVGLHGNYMRKNGRIFYLSRNIFSARAQKGLLVGFGKNSNTIIPFCDSDFLKRDIFADLDAFVALLTIFRRVCPKMVAFLLLV